MTTKRIVEWRQPNFHNVGGIFVLKPGVNEIENALVEKALDIAVFRWYVDQGIVRLGKGPAPVTLKGLKPVDALELVRNTVDAALLDRWYGGESRKQIRDAITERLELLTKPSTEGKAADDAADTGTSLDEE